MTNLFGTLTFDSIGVLASTRHKTRQDKTADFKYEYYSGIMSYDFTDTFLFGSYRETIKKIHYIILVLCSGFISD